jgi:hypothetical protein
MNRPVVLTAIIIAAIVLTALFIRFIIGGDEDTWLCQAGQWVKHGQPAAARPTTSCPGSNNTNRSYYDAVTEPGVIAQKKLAIEQAYPDLTGFEQTEGFAGHDVKVVSDGSDHYFAYLVLGSGVPIAQVTCYRVDRAMRVFKVGEYPDPVDSVVGYSEVNPKNCRGQM